jgi:hypothetical protein
MNRIIGFAIVLALAMPLSAQDGVTITKDKDSLEFKIGKTLVSKYHFGDKVAKPYFWPMNAPGDIPVTRAWPMLEGEPKETKDHVHQKSAWFCHGDVSPEGIEVKQKIKGVDGVDFWSENTGHGRIVCVDVGTPKNGPHSSMVSTRNEWRTADGMKIMDEARVIRFQDLGHARLFVLEIDLHASVCPITFGDTKEGSMGVRVNDEIVTKNGGHFYNADGKVDEKGIWGYKSLWCDYVGKVKDKLVGIAVFDDPSNQTPAYWHARGYGLMAANPFGRNKSGFPDQKGKSDLVKLAKGDHLKLRYGILLHTGDTKDGKVAEAFEGFKKRVD